MKKPNADIVLGFFTGALLVFVGSAAISAPVSPAPSIELGHSEPVEPVARVQALLSNGRKYDRHGRIHYWNRW